MNPPPPAAPQILRPAPKSPAHGPARLARNDAEAVLLSVREIPLELDRPGVGERLRRAIDALYATLDSDLDSPAHLDGLLEASSALAEARALLARASAEPATIPPLARALATLDAAVERLRPAADAVSTIQVERRMSLRRAKTDEEAPKPRPFRASRGLPELHSLARPPLPIQVQLDPVVPLDAPAIAGEPPPKLTMAELDAMAKAGAEGKPIVLPGDDDEPDTERPPPPAPVEYAYEPAIEEREVVRQLARAALEDIAALSTLRHPIPTETWLDQGPFEQRLLNNVDYFASLGSNALSMVSLYHAESETPDPARAFAVAFALGCIEGSDAAYAAAATFKQSPPEEYPGWTEGWWLAPSPAIDEAVGDLLDQPKPRLVGVAVDVLALRGTLPPGAAEALLGRGDPELTMKVARALGRSEARDVAARLLEPLLEDGVGDEIFAAALESLFRRGVGRAREAARRVVMAGASKRLGAAAWLLCLGGHPDDATLVVETAASQPSPGFARGLGRFGHATAAPLLISWLRAGDEDLAAAAADALDGLTGAGLHETVEEPWEVELPPEALEIEGVTRPMRKVVKVVVDPAAWTAWWDREHARFDPKLKWRAGRPFTPAQLVDELEAKETRLARRREAALELAIALGAATPFSPDDWVARQKKHLGELRDLAAAKAPPAGAWWLSGVSMRGSP